MHIFLRQFAGATNHTALHKSVSHAAEEDGSDGDIEPVVQPDPSPNVEKIQNRNSEQTEHKQSHAKVDSEASIGFMSVKDDQNKAKKGGENISDGEDPIHVGIGVDIGEIIDGGDESVPGEEAAGSEDEIRYVSYVERIFRNFSGCGAVEEEWGGFGVGGGGGTVPPIGEFIEWRQAEEN